MSNLIYLLVVLMLYNIICIYKMYHKKTDYIIEHCTFVPTIDCVNNIILYLILLFNTKQQIILKLDEISLNKNIIQY